MDKPKVHFAPYQVWRVHPNGEASLLSAASSLTAQEAEMDYWAKSLKGAQLEYRTGVRPKTGEQMVCV